MRVVRISDLADGVARLEVDEQGRAATTALAVDLDHVDATTAVAAAERLAREANCILVGVATRSVAPAVVPLLDLLTVTLGEGDDRRLAGAPADLESIATTVVEHPVAALTLAHLLEATAGLDVPSALLVESLAYSALLAGPDFAAWRSSRPVRHVPDDGEPVRLAREAGRLLITLDRPARHNAFGRAVRDGLLAGLEVARLDGDIAEVVVSGTGPSFCSGGDLDEFGTAADVAAAHVVRVSRSAGRAVHELGHRVRFIVHGACIGAGVELPSFAPRVDAHEGTWFQLPELALGLVPGAGGTVSLPRRIGRWRTAYLCLTGRRLDLQTALAWGLVDGRA